MLQKASYMKTTPLSVRPQAPWKRATERSEALGESQRLLKQDTKCLVLISFQYEMPEGVRGFNSFHIRARQGYFILLHSRPYFALFDDSFLFLSK